MRSGGYSLHHSLTAEAAGVVKQAVALAKRRGHAQVSPLHVASAMLSSPQGLLKRACLQSHSHPLQCKALELCFNVALNRLPTSASSSPLLGGLHHHLPSLSNALVAAFKRAQAHQRRGSIENQQQPILALKVEIEQLVISILDDPSVSRVMREAGFSSTQVKSNVEQAIKSKDFIVTTAKAPPSPPSTNLSQFHINDDVSSVIEAMASKKTRNTVIVGECSSTSEDLVKKVMERFDMKEVPQEMKSVQFISVPLSTLGSVSKEEFEVKLGELRSLVKSYVGRGVVLYLGDLNWVSDFWCKRGEEGRSVFYSSPVEYMIMELSRLVCGSGESYEQRLWLMGIATFQTYAKCRSGRPSLENLWSLHPLTLPLGTLALGLTLHSGMHDRVKKEEAAVEDPSWLLGMKKQLVCCWECAESFKKEAMAVMNNEELVSSSSTAALPLWLQQYKDEKRKQQLSASQESDKIKDICKKWNSICSSVHRKPHFLEKVLNLSSSCSPSSSSSTSASLSSSDHNQNMPKKIHRNLLNWPTILDREVSKPAAPKPELLSNPNSSPNSASSSEASGDDTKLLELNAEALTAALEKGVPWMEKDIISQITTTILRCRSKTRESWLSFVGPDRKGKETMAREIAKAVFGSREDFVAIGMSSFDTIGGEEVGSRRKRGRSEGGGGFYDRFVEAVRDNPRRLFYVEDVDEEIGGGGGGVKGFEGAMREGGVLVGGELLLLKDAIVVFSCDQLREREEDEEEEAKKQRGSLDLNVATEDRKSVCGNILESVDMQVEFRINPTLVN